MAKKRKTKRIAFGDPEHSLSAKQASDLATAKRHKNNDWKHKKTKRKEAVDGAIQSIKEAVMDDTIDKEELGKRALNALGDILDNTEDERLRGTTAKTLLDYTVSKPTFHSESKIEVKREPTSEELLEEFDETIDGITRKSDTGVVDEDKPDTRH